MEVITQPLKITIKKRWLLNLVEYNTTISCKGDSEMTPYTIKKHKSKGGLI